ncbi:NAD(P)/FAD-dependent oxidoreductase [Phenylobacterium sp.]|uniref:NAD(P)/FAD-dependent oxidoreductase n=1 Tax=Phenylobacterium sp. TaxID=1871053 RepID=UPI0035AEFE86
MAGAGAFGLACAVRLARAGAEVVVFDAAAPTANASGVAAGMLAPVFESALDEAARPHFALLAAARELWPAFAQETGIELDRRGALAVGDADRLEALAAKVAVFDTAAARLDMDQAAALAPGLSGAYAGGLFTAEDWRIDAAAAIAALRRAAEAQGVVFRPEPLRDLGDADRLVIATGAAQDLSHLAPALALLAPIKGHILRLPGAAYQGVVVRGPAAYAAPAGGGLAVGATMEAGAADCAIDPARAAALQAAGEAMFPALAGADVRPLAAVRAATPDGLPLVGPTDDRRVLLAVGARRNGWLLAPMVSRIIAAYVQDADPGARAEVLRPARFG